MAVLDARKIAAQQSGAAFDITLRKAAIAPVRANYLANVYLRLFFRHSGNPDNRA
jgi:hypothetical protein